MRDKPRAAIDPGVAVAHRVRSYKGIGSLSVNVSAWPAFVPHALHPRHGHPRA